MVRNMKRRIDKGVFDMPEDLWVNCKKYGVSSSDILFEKKRFMMIGVNVNYSTAAGAALTRKTGVPW